MRVLWVKAGKILPVDTGGKLRSYHLAKQLASRHELTFLSYYDGPADERYERDIAKEFPDAVTIRSGWTLDDPVQRLLHYAGRLPSSAPYAVTKFTVPEVRRRITTWMRDRRFDVMIADFLASSLNFPRTLDVPCVLFQHNVESVLWRRQARHEPNPITRLIYSLEAAKMLRYERRTVRRFHHVIAVSDTDRDLMADMIDPRHISVVPTGVDLSRFKNARSHHASRPVVLFLGSMDWEANIDGVEWFVENSWARIAEAVPDAQFRIVGRNPHPRITRLAGGAIDVTGTVPSVVEHLAEAAVVVVPLRIGGGTRLKIFEAMAAGRAVVSTRIGAEGLEVTHDRDIVLEDEPRGFADAVIRILRDPATRDRLGRGAAALAERHDWREVFEEFDKALQRAMEQDHKAPLQPVAAS
jgi:glycosyltransferase involved in cell wall biosynthesis